jgi:hypothetical protein
MSTPRLYRLRRAGELRAIADTLLDTATHHGLQDFVRRAVSHIEEASEWLASDNVDTRPALLTIIDMDLAFAEYRLRAAKSAMNIHGPDVDRIG